MFLVSCDTRGNQSGEGWNGRSNANITSRGMNHAPSDLTAAGHVRGCLFGNPEPINSEWIFYETDFSDHQSVMVVLVCTKRFSALRGWISFKEGVRFMSITSGRLQR